MLSVLLPESFGCYPAPSVSCLQLRLLQDSPEVRQSPVILMTSLGFYFIVVLSYRKKRTVSTLIFIKTIKNRILYLRMPFAKT